MTGLFSVSVQVWEADEKPFLYSPPVLQYSRLWQALRLMNFGCIGMHLARRLREGLISAKDGITATAATATDTCRCCREAQFFGWLKDHDSFKSEGTTADKWDYPKIGGTL